MRGAWLLALLMAACCAAQPRAAAVDGRAPDIRVGVFSLFRPTVLRVRSGEKVTVCRLQHAEAVCTSGRSHSQGKRVPVASGPFVLIVPGKIQRAFTGALEVVAGRRALFPVVTMPLETAVASAVAAESGRGTPLEALRSQAVVARSFYSAAHRRHRSFDFCDTTHCQFLRAAPGENTPTARAVRDTAGLALFWNGRPVAALFTASCGGKTRELPGVDPDEYPFFSVDCEACRSGRTAVCSYCTRSQGRWANRRGGGAGHGLGLCQTGAAAMAEGGATFQKILEHFFPNTSLAALGK